MNIIHSKLHGVLDYVTTAFLFVSPWLFSFTDVVLILIIVLAGLQLVLTVCTDYECGIFKKIPFLLHGFIEFGTSFLFVFAAIYARYEGFMDGFYFFIALAIVYMVVFNLTDFNTAAKHA